MNKQLAAIVTTILALLGVAACGSEEHCDQEAAHVVEAVDAQHPTASAEVTAVQEAVEDSGLRQCLAS